MSTIHYPLHPAQRDIFIDQVMNPTSLRYSQGCYLTLKGPLDKNIFFSSVKQMLFAYDVFRLQFDIDDLDSTAILVAELPSTVFTEKDFSGESEEIALIWMQEQLNIPIVLKPGHYPHKHYLLKINDDTYWYFIHYHHIILDGFGLSNWLKEVAQYYRENTSAISRIKEGPSYVTLMKTADECYKSHVYEETREYWKNKFTEPLPSLLDKKYPIKGKETSGLYTIELNTAQTAYLDSLKKGAGVGAGLSAFSLAVLTIYLGQVTEENTFTLGVTLHKRRTDFERSSVGMFSGILPFSCQYDPEKSFYELLADIMAAQKESYPHYRYMVSDFTTLFSVDEEKTSPFEIIVNHGRLDFALDFGQDMLSDLKLVRNNYQTLPLEIFWRDFGNNQPLQLEFIYNKVYFSPEEIQLFASRFLYILEQCSYNPEAQLKNIQVLPSEELSLLEQYSNNKEIYTSEDTVISMFAAKVAAQPDAVAVIAGEKRFTYSKLAALSDALAVHLKEKGVKPGMPVLLCMERTPELMITILAILKAGAAYVPVEPDLPAERLQVLMEEVDSKIVVTTLHYASRFIAPEIICIDSLQLHSGAITDIAIQNTDMAYIMFTSGSTGKPKGVMVTHRNVVSLVKATDYFPITANDCILAGGSFAFDASTFEYWGALLKGGTLVMATKAELMDAATLKSIIRTQKVTKMFFTTGWFNLLADTDVSIFETLTAVIVGGERFSVQHARKVAAHCKNLQIVNGYGPTENTTFSMGYLIGNNNLPEEVPIGKPLNFRSAYILNKHQELVPIGVTGELYVGGAGLTNGYYKKPELTDAAFVSHLFKENKGEKLYRTGDLVRWLPDGNILFVGRADDQVKIRGFRIEPAEITAVLLQSPMIKQAVVMARPDATGVLQLVAYVIESENPYKKDLLLQWLEMKLPDYMIPAHIVLMEALPLNSNGKVDRKALPIPENTVVEQSDRPRNETEHRLAKVWQDLLQVPEVGIRDNFFHLGGHSLMAMRISAFIKNEWGQRVAPTVLFTCKTIERLAAYIDQLQEEEPTEKVIRSEEYHTGKLPLSFGQERMWFLDRLHGSVQYHIILAFRLTGELDIPSLEKALGYMIDRHEVLRTVIRQDDGVPYQHILERNTWKIDMYEDDFSASDEQSVQFLMDDLVIRPFDLSDEHMLRAHLIPLSSQKHILVINIHHIAADGWSLSVLTKELDTCYRAYRQGKEPALAALPFQYKDYSVWQRQQEAVLAEKLDYWKSKLNGVVLLNMPTDYARSAKQSVRGDSMKFRVDKELTEQLKLFSVKEDVTLYMTLLTTFKVLLHRYCSQDDICVGGAISGRLQQEFEPLIGFFVNTLALRTDLGGQPGFREALQRVKKTLLEAYDHQEVPFERVVNQVQEERDTSRNPLFQVVFVLQNAPDMEMNKLDEIMVDPISHRYRTSQFDLHFSIHETRDGLYADVAYCNDLFKASTIERLLGHFETLLRSVVTAPDRPIGKMTMLSTAETDQLLYSFSGVPATYPTQQTIVGLFADQVMRTPDHIAVSFEGEDLSYRTLDEQSTRLAVHLRLAGVDKGTLVPICTGHCLEMMVGILGILKAGGVYIPVDPEYPEDRIGFILNDTNAPVVLVVERTLPVVKKIYESRLICVDGDWDVTGLTADLPACDPGQPAYIIYTSGSTGRPKGVIIPHRNVVRLFMTSVPLYDFNEHDVWTMFHSYCFDFSVWEMYGALFYGGRLVIVPRTVARDTMAFTKLLVNEGVTVLNQTPSAFYVLQEYILLNPVSLGVRYVIFGGEALHPLRLKGWHKLFPACKLINMYGITETTVHVTYQEITEKEMNGSGSIIGKTIPTLWAYILDKNLQPVPIGVPGELCIAGEGVATGYLNREELTAERFVRNPFSEDEHEKLYRAGDLGKWLEDGTIEYLGRIDHQVKIRGYRIELGEIEHALNKLPEVAESCVVIKNSEDQSDKKLVCYYVPDLSKVKNFEKFLYQDHVNKWQRHFEETYDKKYSDDGTAVSDTTGWYDSFTGEAIPETERKEWLNDSSQIILAHQPQHVLEIGCGTGSLYDRLAPHIKQYTGIDLSHHSIEKLHSHKDDPNNFPATQLHACAAHEMRSNEIEGADTIVLNSVIQYFPGEDYLTDIILDNITRLNGYGRIIIGDVRDYRLLHTFKSRLCLDKIQEHTGIDEFRWLVDQEMMKEEELCFAPDYFYQLTERFPDITHVDIRWKTGNENNERTLYRFTVILHIGTDKQLLKPEWMDWNLMKTDPEKWIQNGFPVVAISNMPNYRLWKEQQLVTGLTEKTTINVRDLRHAVGQPSQETGLISAFLKKASEKGYHIRMMPAVDPLCVNVLLEQNPTADFVDPLYEVNYHSAYNNIPLFSDIIAVMQKQIKEALARTIPEYMVPADIIALQHMPVTSNGKTDRGFLSQIEDQQRKRSIGYEMPVSAMEIVLADIWQEILSIERVGVLDNFFEIGGDSIRVVKVAARIKNRIGVEISVADIYGTRTVRDLAVLLENTNYENTNEVLKDITEELSDLEKKYLPLLDSGGNLESVYPMTSIQNGMIYASLRDPDSSIYHDQFLYPVERKIDRLLFESALKLMVDKHETFRTTFHLGLHETGLQAVSRSIPVMVEELDLSDKDINGVKQYLTIYLEKERVKSFDIQEGPLWRAALLHWHEGTVFILQFHHAILDGWSVAAFNTELFNLYLQLEKNPVHQPLPRLNGHYRDFVKEEMSRKKQAQDHIFWQTEMEDHQRLDIFTHEENYENVVVGYDIQILNHLKDLTKEYGLSLKGIFLGISLYVTSMLSYRRKITIGLVANNRPIVEDGDKLLGCFLNTIPFVLDMPGSDISWIEYFRTVEDKLKQLEIHDRTPLAEIARINGESSPKENPFFDVIFNFINFHIYDELEKDLVNVQLGKESLTDTSFGVANTFLNFSISLTGDDMKIVFSLSRMLQSGKTAGDLKYYFDYVLDCFRHRATQKIEKQLLLPMAEHDYLIKDLNNSGAIFSQDSTLSSGFDKAAENHPDKIALVTAEKEYTYRRLQDWVNRLAALFISAGIKPGMYVPVIADRTANTVASILAIMKAGAAYVPIDPKMPENRMLMILNDTKATIVVGHQLPVFQLSPGAVFVNTAEVSSIDAADVFPVLSSSSYAYVIYTSGSTGVPKGVPVKHRSVVNLIEGCSTQLDFSADERSLQFTNFTFDASVEVMFLSLLKGAALVVPNDEVLHDPDLFCKFVKTQNITHLVLTPGFLQSLGHIRLSSILKRIVVGGEECPPMLAEYWSQYVDFYNEYGPTESTVTATRYKYTGESLKKIPIGKPVQNVSVYVLDELQQVLPSGVTGEIYIGGEGVTDGYLNRPELTEQRFIPDVFTDVSGAVLYRTGDIGRWLPDGNLEYQHRADNQVKVRGYRIEPGEIESVLLQHPDIKQAAVLVQTDMHHNNRLIAYVSVVNGLSEEDVISYLREQLPYYMIPAYIQLLSQIPLTFSGKVDRNALSISTPTDSGSRQLILPANPLENMLADIWRELLNVNEISTDDDFFALGGHSLTTLQLLSRIRAAGYEVQLQEILAHTTIAGQAVFLMNNQQRADSDKAMQNEHIRILNKSHQPQKIFLLPGSNGNCDGYDELAASLAALGTVYGIQMMGVLEGEKPLYNMREIAELQLSWIQEIQPTGPYQFIAHSFGGHVLFEMIKQLEQAGEKVEMASILDVATTLPDMFFNAGYVMNFVMDSLAKYGLLTVSDPEWKEDLHTELITLISQKKIPDITELLKHRIITQPEGNGLILRIINMNIANMMLGHAIEDKIDTPLIIIKAAENRVSHELPALGWENHSTSVQVAEVAGDHFTMLYKKSAVEIATLVQQFIVELAE
ncbi:amino acid adenylation domain-containing protein [Chryseobacterium sp. WG23]|uniref:non-ribosomal peptide synthetase n=1 Tax=Chryseobacterium sp. WG23 TaxID=2926910 RepID=UPI00211DB04C|nr:non-ribosomal peptide synthetase [Chryseobacterium sp. WG23]MCQ9637621.1 amino acid adenylation domain-containing protein [Chryseobacterium sp. WG23]